MPYRAALEKLKAAVRPYYLRWVYFPLFPYSRPPQFVQCWNYPYQALTEDLGGAGLRGGSRAPDLLFLPMTDWHTRMQRTQHLAMALAQLGHRCFYVNPHLGREFPRPYLLDRSNYVAEIAPAIYELHVHLPGEPVYHHRTLTPGEVRRVFEAASTLLRAAGSSRVVLVVSFPLWDDVARLLAARFRSPIVYDCHDHLAGFGDVAPQIVAAEPGLLADTGLAIFSSAQLMEQACADQARLRSRSILLRNAVSAGHFREPPAQTDTPVIGYAGALDRWFDLEAVEHAASRHPEWQFVLVGAVRDNRLLRLQNLPNVEFVGEVPYCDLPKQLARFTVGTIPFVVNPLTIATNPIKVYEYFARGIPVVSAPLPEVTSLGRLVYVAASPEEFVIQLESAVSENDPDLESERRRVAETESWRSRAETLLAEIRTRWPATTE
jgi:O-antigen biosynthesis protein